MLVDRVSSFIYLVVVIDKGLTWKDHIECIVGKAHQRVTPLRRSRDLLRRKSRILFYKCLIFPILEYASVVWSNCSKILFKKVISIKGYSARLITDSKPGTRTAPLKRQLRLLRLESRAGYFKLFSLSGVFAVLH